MLNQVILVGRIQELHEGKILVNIPRNYKNKDGEYESDLVTIAIEGKINESVNEYCNKGDIVGIKGRIEILNDNTLIKAEKITFLSAKSQNDKDEEEEID
jgi:single-strand DNA-binding protein